MYKIMLNTVLPLNLWENAYCLYHGDGISQQKNQNIIISF